MNRFSVLLYHEILGPEGFSGREGQPIRVASGYRDVLPPPLHVHESDFAAQMDFLDREGWHVMDLAELRAVYPAEGTAAYRGPDLRLPERSVLISFDDLYQSQADRAVPILRRHGFRALGFVCADWLFGQAQPRSLSQPVGLSWPELAAIGDTVTPCNHSRSLHTRSGGRAAIEVLASAPPGSADEARARRALVEDTREAERMTGGTGVYAWPFGAAPEPAEPWLREAGVRLAFTTQPGSNHSGTLPLRLQRSVVPFGMDLAGFARLLAD